MENKGVRFPGKYKIFLANDIFPYTGTVFQRKSWWLAKQSD